MTAGESSESTVPRTLPRGRHDLDGSVVRESQRVRMLEAMVSLSAEQGYAATSVADVIARSGVSRKSFYEHFANKEDCFLAAYERGVKDLAGRIAVAVQESEAAGVELVRVAVGAYIDSLVAMPDFARILAIEALAAGPVVRKRRDEGFERFIELYRNLYNRSREQDPGLPELDESIFVAAIGAVAELIRRTVSLHGPGGLQDVKESAIEITASLLHPPPTPAK
ncbi:MAG: TetR/AcrR family transcriptional regulator [Solirubrobacterales bacterium]